jgi:diguanylate cyclase (GGDEF)-like protein/PAS domain S-box-containing protein
VKGEHKTRAHLIDELAELRQRVAELEAVDVKRKRAVQELRESEEQLEVLFEFAPDAYYMSDLKGTFVDGNKAAEELTGYDRNELIGQSFLKLKLLSLGQTPKAAALLARNALGQATGPDEFVLNRKDGGQVPVEIRTFPVRIKGQTVVLGIARDITERKRAEDALRDTVAELTVIHQNVPVAMLVVDRERRVRKVNDAAALFARRPADEMLSLYGGEALRCLHHLDDPKGCGFGPACATCSVRLAVLDTFADKRSRRDIEAWLPFPQGDSVKERCLLVSTAYLQLGDAERVLVCAQDITKRKQVRLEIEQRQMYLEGVLKAAPDAIVTLDARHRIVEWNPGAENLFGYSREEAIDQDIDDLITGPEVYDEAVEFTQVAAGGMEVPPTETVRYRKDGSPVDVIVAGSPIVVGDELIGTVAVYTDITQRVRMEETLRAMALVDDLTGLYNRRGFSILAEHQLKMAERGKRRMVLLFADLDGMKHINDTFGHSEGDRALIQTADILEETFRESDIVARIGGDEFVVLAIETNGAPAESLVYRLRDNLAAHNTESDCSYELSLSVGIAHYHPEHPRSIEELLTQADRAMYEQKRG